ncbi:MAG: DALR anticodon-binding domain-containing protein, partial [Nanopusillaceae archaeon]
MKSLEKIYGYKIPKKIDHYYGDFVYVVVNKLYEIIPELEKYKQKVIYMIEKGNNEIYELSKEISDKILLEQLKTLWNFDIYYDIIIRESDILKYNLFNRVFNILREKGIVKPGEEKSYYIDLSRWKDLEKAYGSDKKYIIRKDGTATYLAKDIAYAFWKVGLIENTLRFKESILQPNKKYIYEIKPDGDKIFEQCDLSINVIGKEQTAEQLIIKRIIEEMDKNKKYIHYGYELVMLNRNTAKIFGVEGDMVRMSGRKGLYINVDDLYEKLYNIVYEKFKDEDIARKITKSFICLEMLKYDKNTVINFDIDKMLNIEEGNAIYFLYTYARINSLLEKANWDIPKEFEIKELNKYEERLILKLFEFKDKLLEVEENLELNRLYKYLIELVRAFNEFYQNVPILNYKDKYPHRLFLVYLTKEVLDKIFYILKIEPVNRI